MKNLEITEDIIRDLKSALGLVKEKGETIAQLQTAVAGVEARLLELAQTPSFRPKELYQRDTEAQAKRFVDFARELFPHSQKTTISTVQSSTDADGGYTIPGEFRNVLVRLIDTYGAVRNAATIFPMATDTVKLPEMTSGLTVGPPEARKLYAGADVRQHENRRGTAGAPTQGERLSGGGYLRRPAATQTLQAHGAV